MEKKKVEKKKSVAVQKWTSVTDRQKHRFTDTEDERIDGWADGLMDRRMEGRILVCPLGLGVITLKLS